MPDKTLDGRKSKGLRRRQQICELLLEKGYVDAAQVSKQLGVNIATIRRDLDRLEAQGALRRTHGGAQARSAESGIELDFGLRMGFNIPAKRRIARQAAAMIEDGDTVFLDAGTTAIMVAEELLGRQSIAVVTNSFAAAEVLKSAKGVDLFLLGGRYLPHTRSLIGPLTEDAIRAFRFRKMILATAGIDFKNRALTLSSMEEVPIKRAAMSQSEQIILVADQSKFNKPSLISMIPLHDITAIVTDAAPTKDIADVCQSMNVELVVV